MWQFIVRNKLRITTGLLALGAALAVTFFPPVAIALATYAFAALTAIGPAAFPLFVAATILAVAGFLRFSYLEIASWISKSKNLETPEPTKEIRIEHPHMRCSDIPSSEALGHNASPLAPPALPASRKPTTAPMSPTIEPTVEDVLSPSQSADLRF